MSGEVMKQKRRIIEQMNREVFGSRRDAIEWLSVGVNELVVISARQQIEDPRFNDCQINQHSGSTVYRTMKDKIRRVVGAVAMHGR